MPAIAVEPDCSQKTVRCWLHRFNRLGLQGLEDLGGQGRKGRRITEEERSRIISLVKTVPPGRLRWEPVGELWAFDESGPSEWTLDSLGAAARAEGIEVGRSQVRRELLAEGMRWRGARSWMRSKDRDFVPKGQGSSASTPTHPPDDATVICADELGPVRRLVKAVTPEVCSTSTGLRMSHGGG
ncbi:helix-turn-helix domain-containing protein [Streptomyces mirabilis]|uniref:helix-turn-helix domain-containing protein n=1 Tax=Streptomyces mirabilis TaxID=68239 RepID=UPI0039A53FDD